MNRFKGCYFDGVTSKAHQVIVSKQGPMLTIEGDGISTRVKLEDCTTSPGRESALGQVLYTPQGGRLDVVDPQAFSSMPKEIAPAAGLRIVSLLERRLKYVLLMLLLVASVLGILGIWGVPYLAKLAAFSLPDKVVMKLGDQIFAQVDHLVFQPSELDQSRQEYIRRLVDDFTDAIGVDRPRSLYFRKSPYGPNAFAFPGRIIVMTDELALFVVNDAELLGVAAHEIAHLEARHALQSALQNSGVSLIVSLLAGDRSSMSSVMGTITTLLLNSRYSRKFEQEADNRASLWMEEAGYGVEPLITFLERLKNSDERSRLPEFFSSHPTLENRLMMLRTLPDQSRH